MPNPTVRSSTTAVDQTGATASLTVPTGTVAADATIIIQATTLGGGSNPAAPAGFTQLFAPVSWGLSGANALQGWYSTADLSGSSITINGPSGGVAFNYQAYRLSIQNPPASMPEGTTVAATGLGSALDAGSYTTTHANDLLFGLFGSTAPATPIAPDASYTDIGHIGASGPQLDIGYKSVAAAGVVGSNTATAAFSRWVAMVMAIIPGAGVAPTASFTRTPTSGPPGTLVTVTDTSTGTPTSWDYDWGDGSTHSTTQNPTHTYTRPGTYTITQTATNASGSTTSTATVVIGAFKARPFRHLRRHPSQ